VLPPSAALLFTCLCSAALKQSMASKNVASAAASAIASSGRAAGSAAAGAGAAASPPVLLKRAQLLSLYKAILRSAATFPSSKRKGIIRDIKADWRDHRDWTDPIKLHTEHTRAVDGLRMLQQYSSLNTKNSSAWNLHLGRQ
jgi:hypothetical protein